MYAAGAPHRLREPSLAVMGLLARHGSEFVTDAEIFQEILHRYRALDQWERGWAIFERLWALISSRTEPVFPGDVQRAAHLANRITGPSARDLLHVAVMERLGCTHIVSADRGFDAFPGITRLDPVDVPRWRALVEQP
ncbi:MAG TPA: type II toxin-antitoxin system VapC family toxin [Tepidiformaceae bacterium]|nr:type II toxin-antitoxin system VapC family toxin [Tepidiformaceae bacterium]